MEDEIIEIYEYNDQTLELSLVTEEEIPEALEVVRDTFENGQRIKSARSFAWNLMKKCVLI